ncbi:hypothetical protein MT372_24285, partial [Vibrio parahaemolyticus]|nr:hypothetical protein [Vibrio parahaemolyticus]
TTILTQGVNVPNIGPVVVTRHALERFVERLSDGAPKHPWKALCSKLLCSGLTKTQLPENVAIQKAKKYAQEAEFWQHIGSKLHFVLVPSDQTKTLVTVFSVK